MSRTPFLLMLCLFLFLFCIQVVTGTPQLLVAEGVSNTFDGSRFQFEDLALTVCKGQKLGLVGINGCGKSTLLKVRRVGGAPRTLGSVRVTCVLFRRLTHTPLGKFFADCERRPSRKFRKGTQCTED